MDDFSGLVNVADPVVVPYGQGHPNSKYNPRTIARLMRGLRKGLTRKMAAQYAGISSATLYEYLAHYPCIASGMEIAEAHAASRHLDTINRSSLEKGNWLAAAWWLERRHPEAYARRERVTVDVSDRLKLVAEELGLSMEEVEAEAQRVSRLNKPQ